jgi:type IV pilus assembly protein PilW
MASAYRAGVPLRAGGQLGLSLVEFMVAITISMVLVLAAASMFLATRESQRSIDQASSAHEAGAYALRLIGRDVLSAGFYPAVRPTSPDLINLPSAYANITGRPAYEFGIFGCEGARLDPTSRTCGNAVSGAPDTLVIGYFTDDSFGTSIGHRADCTGNDVTAAAENAGRAGTGGASAPPGQPLFVANHYTLVATTMSIDGRSVATRSLACLGNGAGAAGYQTVSAGVDDLQFTYAVFSDSSRVPERFYTASQVSGMSDITIDGEVFRPWARVVAVRVCVIARTYEARAALTTDTYEDCDGAQKPGDGSLRKTYTQVFGLRNRQTKSY